MSNIYLKIVIKKAAKPPFVNIPKTFAITINALEFWQTQYQDNVPLIGLN